MRRALKIAGNLLTIIITLSYLLSSLAPYVSPEYFSWGTLFSLAYLPILLIYGGLIIAWSFIKKKTALLLLIISLAGFANFTSTVGLNILSPSWKLGKDSNAFRIMCWNVNFFGDPYIINDTPGNVREKMLAYIKEIQPDILCLQDFSSIEEGTVKNVFYNNMHALDSAGNFLSEYFPFFYEHNGPNYSVKSGVAFFSKLPIKDTGSFNQGGVRKREKAGYIDVIAGQRTLRIFGAHLSSMGLWPNVSGEAGLSYLKGDSTQQRTSTILSKLRYYDQAHAREAEVIKNEINKRPYPLLLSIDMNALPSTYVYHTLKKGLSDAFLEKDFGIGGTYNMVFPKIRIDVLLHSKEIEVLQYTRPAVKLSDHYPIIADIRWK